MTAPRLTRREVVLVAITALVCFAIAIPLTSASSLGRQFTVWPGNSARFADMDWNCDYFARATNSGEHIECGRESTTNGLRVVLSGEALTVIRCTGGSAAKYGSCKPILLNRPRTP